MKECNQILSGGIMNTIIRNESESITTNLIKWFESSKFEDVQKAKDRGFKFKFTVPIQGVPVPFDLGGADAEQQFNRLKEHIARGEVEQMSMTKTTNFVQENVSEELVKAWERTMAKVLNHCSIVFDPPQPQPNPQPNPQPQPNPGPHYGLNYEINQSDDRAIIRVFYNKTNASDSYPIVESFRIIGGELLDGALEPGTIIDNEKIITVRQTSNQEVLVLLSTDKQDLDIKFTSNVLESLFLKIFLYKIPLNSSQHVYSKKVPSGFKVISGGFNTKLGPDLANCIPTSSYPSAIDEWTIQYSSKIEGINDQMLYMSITTVYDPNNQWDIQIFSNQTRHGSSINCSPAPNYMMVGGGMQFSILGGNNESEILNQEDYRTGIQSCYPKNDNTWEATLTETDLQRVPSWDLFCYAVGIRRNSGLENVVKTREHVGEVRIDDQIYYVTSGGVYMNGITDRNTYLGLSILSFYTQGTPSDLSVPVGWTVYAKIGTPTTHPTEFICAALAIKHPSIEFLPLEDPNDVLNRHNQ
ncbi:hypothetical protein bthur0013_64840 [Bacillus thuringiensis IBL 200]|nr:hypothetical protein [Bacillus thuringiensis]EEM92191.1 hypothetical protein bthur0013_64840 [Bacillus thuringiensis IBL 200]